MLKPRLVYYNDAHHFNGKRIEPPASIHMLQWPVDEVLGTGVDLLVFGLGYGDVYFHDSKVGRVVGQKKEVWENFIDWRIMRMVEEARKKGTDQLREVINRGRATGLKVFPSLKLQASNDRYGERCGLLKWEHGKAVCIGEPGRQEWAYDFSNELVRQDKLAMIREVLQDYGADGIELDFMFGDQYFKSGEIEKNTPLMTSFVADIRGLANEIGAAQDREIGVMARVPLKREDNIEMGLDVETWLKDGSVQLIVGQDGDVVSETGVQARWMPEAANAAGGAAYYRPPRRVYDDRVGLPSIEMYRALGQSLQWQGFAGMYHGYLLWPFSHREYQILRECAYPEAHQRRNKRYILQPKEGVDGQPTTTPERTLPVEMKEGETVSLKILVADDVENAKADGEMRRPILTIRYSFYCNGDEIETRFNGRMLSDDEAEITDERGLEMRTRLAGSMSLQAPLGMSAHWFRYKLDIDDVKRGENLLEIETKTQDKKAGFARSVNPNPPKDTDGRREESGRGGEGATGEIAWVPFGVGRSADGLHRRTGAPMAVCGSCDAGDGERIRSRELSRTGLARVCGDLRLSGGWVADGAVRPGVEWLAAGPRRG